MFKGILYITMLISFFMGDYLFSKEAAIYAKYPSEVSAGSDFTVEITIEKGNLSQFGRFHQVLPDGFTATSENKYFEFEDQTVKFLWIHLPAGNTFKFTYTIHVPADFTGEFSMNGTFGYILDNERKFVKLNEESLMVQPDGVAVNSDIKQSASGDQVAPPIEDIYCYRQLFDKGDHAVVKLLVKKEDLNNMAKIVEQIPDGYTVEALESQNSIFSFSDNTVKFMWMNLPVEDEFIVSYKITPENGNSIKDFESGGEFSYSVNNLTHTVTIINQDFEKEQTETVYRDQPVLSEPPLIEIETPTEQVYTQVEDKSSNVQYKIQIAASHKMVNVKRYFKKFRIDDKVIVDMHDGWHKYMIKNFSTYKEAKDYRDKVWKVTPVDDAFVTAYNNGDRITVQEALMITNQKWYK